MVQGECGVCLVSGNGLISGNDNVAERGAGGAGREGRGGMGGRGRWMRLERKGKERKGKERDKKRFQDGI